MSWLENWELHNFKKVGRDIKISRDARIYGAENVELGDNVRIDAGTIILASSGFLKIGSHVHISCQNLLLCGGGIEIGNHCGISFANKLISCSEDFKSGEFLLNPNVPAKYRNQIKSKISLEEFSMLATGSTLSPGTWLREGAVLGAMSFTRPDQVLGAWEVWFGVPPKKVNERPGTGIIDKAEEWEKEYALQAEKTD